MGYATIHLRSLGEGLRELERLTRLAGNVMREHAERRARMLHDVQEHFRLLESSRLRREQAYAAFREIYAFGRGPGAVSEFYAMVRASDDGKLMRLTDVLDGHFEPGSEQDVRLFRSPKVFEDTLPTAYFRDELRDVERLRRILRSMAKDYKNTQVHQIGLMPASEKTGGEECMEQARNLGRYASILRREIANRFPAYQRPFVVMAEKVKTLVALYDSTGAFQKREPWRWLGR